MLVNKSAAWSEMILLKPIIENNNNSINWHCLVNSLQHNFWTIKRFKKLFPTWFTTLSIYITLNACTYYHLAVLLQIHNIHQSHYTSTIFAMQEEAIFTRKESLLFCFFPFRLGIDTTDAVAVLVFLFFLY